MSIDYRVLLITGQVLLEREGRVVIIIIIDLRKKWLNKNKIIVQ